jgi:hypothetical protein
MPGIEPTKGKKEGVLFVNKKDIGHPSVPRKPKLNLARRLQQSFLQHWIQHNGIFFLILF